jgi:hypothetical protein
MSSKKWWKGYAEKPLGENSFNCWSSRLKELGLW